MENTKQKEILENIINVMEKTNVDEWEIDKLIVVLNYINELEKENEILKEKLDVAETNKETFRLEMLDVTKILGLDEHTIFDDVKLELENILRGTNE